LDVDRDKELAGLLLRAQEGDQAAYEGFLIEAAATLRRYIGKRVEYGVVEDVLQDTLLTIHKIRHTHLPGRPVGPWLYAICNNRVADFYRTRRRILRVEADVELDEGSASHSENPAPFGAALDALRTLPERQRRVIELLKVRGLTVKEVAVQTGMSESSVKTTAFRGYETIRKLFGLKK
jgi:RNA polymerase sigma-70 factor (ECF subfamily)